MEKPKGILLAAPGLFSLVSVPVAAELLLLITLCLSGVGYTSAHGQQPDWALSGQDATLRSAWFGCVHKEDAARLHELMLGNNEDAAVEFGATHCQILKAEQVVYVEELTPPGSGLARIRAHGSTVSLWTMFSVLRRQ
jgi:hypothetical protein